MFLSFNVLAELLLKQFQNENPTKPLFRLLLLVLPEMRNPCRSDLAQLYLRFGTLGLRTFSRHVALAVGVA